MSPIRTLLVCAALGACALGCSRADDRPLAHRWLFIMRDHRRPENVAATLDLIPRAAAAGYNAIVLSEGGLYNLDTAGQTLDSDYNTFSESVMRFDILGANYTTVGAYQAGTGQDQNSTVG